MHSYEFYIPAKVLFGIHRIKEIGRILKENSRGTRAALMCSSSEWMQPISSEIVQSIEGAGLEVCVRIDGIRANPSENQCRDALEKYVNGNADILIAAGGGSCLDAAKWLAEKASPDFFISIPTTAGTGGEINQWAVITDDDTHEKKSIQCRAADLAVLDPSVTFSLTPKLTLFSGMDAFSHGLEAMLSTASTAVTDALAFKGCTLAARNLEACLLNGKNAEARSALLEASFLCGAAMLNAGLGILHCVSNILPGIYPEYSHGFICGVLVPGVLEFNKPSVSPEKYNSLKPLVEKTADIFFRYAEEYKVKLPELSEIENSKLKTLVRYAAENINGKTNPVPVTEEGIKDFLQRNF